MYLDILAYRTTPTEIGYSPAELLMNCKLRTTVPMFPELRKPTVTDPSLVPEKDSNLKARQKRNFDKQHGTRELSQLHGGDNVWVSDYSLQLSLQRNPLQDLTLLILAMELSGEIEDIS